MSEKPITHADLKAITWLDNQPVPSSMLEGTRQAVADFLARARAAAEADAPPLPEGWYLWDGARALWFNGSNSLYVSRGGSYFGPVATSDDRDRLTPLRPTITGADVTSAVEAHWTKADCNAWRHLPEWRRDRLIKQTHEFLGELGIEVSKP